MIQRNAKIIAELYSIGYKKVDFEKLKDDITTFIKLNKKAFKQNC